MELYLEINISEINISKFNPALKEENDLSDYYYCHCEQGLEGIIHSSEYYHIKHCKEVFMYLDHLESRVPKSNYDLCWEWRAIRDGKRYYLAVSFDVCRESIIECDNIVNDVFLQNSEQIKGFDWPDIDFSPNEVNDEEGNECEYDDDSDLRLLDHCTKNNPYIRWERPFPERNGAGCNLFSQLAPIATVLLFYYQSKTGLHKKIARKYYKWKINQLYNIIIRDYVSSGSLIKPKPAPPKRHNVKTGKGEYVFIHINEKEQERKIIISFDGKDVRKTEFK